MHGLAKEGMLHCFDPCGRCAVISYSILWRFFYRPLSRTRLQHIIRQLAKALLRRPARLTLLLYLIKRSFWQRRQILTPVTFPLVQWRWNDLRRLLQSARW